jgi:predicted PilT family ATPase
VTATGLTLDTGALVQLEKCQTRVLSFVHSTTTRGGLITVPTAVIAEWWHGQQGPAAKLIASFEIEELSEKLARMAGEALWRCPKPKGKRKGPGVTDAVVMASAAQRGDTVLTGDMDDLELLKSTSFPSVVVLRV